MLQDFLTGELTEISRIERPMFNEPLYRAEQHLGRTLTAFQNRLAGHVQDALGVALEPHDISLEVLEPSAPPVNVGFVDAAFTIISPLLPMMFFRHLIERSLLRKSRWEVEKNLSRLAAGWCERVAVGIAGLARQTEQLARAELDSLEQLLAQSPSQAPGLKQAIDELEQFQSRLRAAQIDSTRPEIIPEIDNP